MFLRPIYYKMMRGFLGKRKCCDFFIRVLVTCLIEGKKLQDYEIHCSDQSGKIMKKGERDTTRESLMKHPTHRIHTARRTINSL